MRKSNSLIALAVVLCMLAAVIPFLGHKVYADGEYTVTFVFGNANQNQHTMEQSNNPGEIIIDGVYVSFCDGGNPPEGLGNIVVAQDGQSATVTITDGTPGYIQFGRDESFNAFTLFVDGHEISFDAAITSNTTIAIQDYVAPANPGGGQQNAMIPLFFQSVHSISGNTIEFEVGNPGNYVTATAQGVADGVAVWNGDVLEIDRQHLNDITFALSNNFDDETMGVYISGANGFGTQLLVNNNVASFDPQVNLPDGDNYMRIGLKADNQQGGGDPGQYVPPENVKVNFGEATYDVQVRTMTKTVTASVEGKNIANAGLVTIGRQERIILDGFDPKSMESFVTLDDGFETELEVREENGVYYTYIDLKKAEGFRYEADMQFGIRRYTSDPPEEPARQNPNEHNIPVTVTSTNAYAKSYAKGAILINGFDVIDYHDFDEQSAGDVYSRNNFEYYYDGSGNVTIAFSTLFVDKFVGNITVNGGEPIPVNTIIDYTNRNEWLDHYDHQSIGFEIQVPYADHYDIVCDIDEMPGENQYIANFLWTDDERAEGQDDYIGPSLLEVVKIEYDIIDPATGDEVTVTVNEDELATADYIEYSPYGEIGSLVCPDFAWVTARITPDYGYQVTEIGVNNQGILTGDEISEFTFQVHKGNFHLGAKTTAVDDVVKSSTNKVKSGTIEIVNGEIDSGSVILSVNDVELSSDKIKDFEGTAGDYEISTFLDIDLDQVFYKGTEDEYWANRIHELDDEATITLKLAKGIDGNKIIIVHNINDGDEYEIIQIDSYDPKTNTITFRTKSFSNYAIASKVDDENPTPTPDDDENETKETASKEVKTGDQIILYFVILAVATVGIIVAITLTKKSKKDNK